MTTKSRNALLALVCLAQLAVPVSLVVKHEQTRANGEPWRFQTAPVDPNDPFRGRYVRLGFAAEREPIPFAETGWVYVTRDKRMYAELAMGADGYARLTRLHEHRPSGVQYVDVFTREMQEPKNDKKDSPSAIFVRLPFDRYYLPEDVAPIIEREYAEASIKAQANTYAEVRVRDGHAALVRLVLDGKVVGAK